MTTSHPPPTERFPPRAVPVGTYSECYTQAELRLIHYVNSVVRGSDKPGTELREALARLEIDATYWEHKERERAELDERADPKDAPQPIAPVAPAPAGVPTCKGEPLSGKVCGCVETGCDACGG